MPRPRRYQGGGGSIDTSGIEGLGAFAQNAIGQIFQQQYDDQRIALERRAIASEEANRRAQIEINRQIAEQQAQQEQQRVAAQRQGKLLNLAQIVPDGETFLKLAPIMAPDLSPAELQGYATFADETSRIRKEEEKRKKEEQQQEIVRRFIPGAVGGLTALPPDVQRNAIAGLGEAGGLPPGIVDLSVLSAQQKQAREAQKTAEANARAQMRSAASLENAAATREATASYRDQQRTTAIRKEFNGLSKDFLRQRDGFQRVLSSAKDASPAGDLALIFNYMKVLDPQSVVRESEFATAAATGAYGERVKAAAAQIATGKRLSDAQRADFVARSKILFHDSAKNQRKLEKRYRKLGKRAGLDPSETASDFVANLWRESRPPPTPPLGEEEAVFLKMEGGNPVFVRPNGSQFMVAP